MSALGLTLFALVWLVIVYLLNCLIARKFKRIDPKQAILYFTSIGAIGVFGEIFLDTIYNHFVGTPLWKYNILPIHNGYTSAYAPIVWGIFGFHIHLLHDTLKSKYNLVKARYLALLMSFEALILEAILTLSSLVVFGTLMYYYFPGDLWHVSSFQNVPFYFICGILIVKTTKNFKKNPVFFSVLSVFFTSVVVFFT